MLKAMGEGLHVLEGEQTFFGLEMGARMTVMELEAGILIHSPLAVPATALSALGDPKWVLAPNRLHHLHIGPWMTRGAQGWAAPGLPAKRPDLSFEGEVDSTSQPFGDDVQLIAMACFPFASEVVVLHRPSRTLVVTDLVFNIAPTAPWLTRFAMTCACGYPGCKTTVLERFGMKRDIARREVNGLLELDFDRLIMAHGEVVETGGKEALRNAFSWLSLGR